MCKTFYFADNKLCCSEPFDNVLASGVFTSVLSGTALEMKA